jgi:hypothetical protein
MSFVCWLQAASPLAYSDSIIQPLSAFFSVRAYTIRSSALSCLFIGLRDLGLSISRSTDGVVIGAGRAVIIHCNFNPHEEHVVTTPLAQPCDHSRCSVNALNRTSMTLIIIKYHSMLLAFASGAAGTYRHGLIAFSSLLY